MDVAALVVAIYAALAATGSVVWRIHEWRREHRLDVEVLASELTKRDIHGSETTVWRVTVVNRSKHAVRVTGATCKPVSRLSPDSWYNENLEVRSMDSVEIEMDIERFMDEEGFGEDPVVGWVVLSTGERFRSHPFFPTTWVGPPSGA